MFLPASTNNHVSTVMSEFLSPADEIGLPSRVSVDRGGRKLPGVTVYAKTP